MFDELTVDNFKFIYVFIDFTNEYKILFGLVLYIPVNSYGHVRTVSSHNHTFFLGMLDLAVNQYFVHILSLVSDNNPS